MGVLKVLTWVFDKDWSNVKKTGFDYFTLLVTWFGRHASKAKTLGVWGLLAIFSV